MTLGGGLWLGDNYNTTFMGYSASVILVTSSGSDVEHDVVIFNNYNPTGVSDDDAAYVLYQFYP